MKQIDIINSAKSALIDGYTPVEKLRESGYFIKCVKDEIGRIAFENDYELTIDEETEIVNAILS